MGRLSDKRGKKLLLLLCYLSMLIALCILVVAREYWSYVIGILFVNIMSYASTPVVAKMAYNEYPKEYINQAETLANASVWVGAIGAYVWVGFASSSLDMHGVQTLGIVLIFMTLFLALWKIKDKD
jgi:MFS family permease